MIAALSQYADDLMTWQLEVIEIWRNMVDATALFNQLHPSQQIMVQEHYPELFEYLAEQRNGLDDF